MGHSTATEIVTLNEIPEDDPSLRAYHRFYPRSLEGRILSVAVRKWNDEKAGRYDSANPGNPVMLEPVPVELTNEATDRHFHTSDRGYNSSPVVPIISKDDYEIKSKVITVKLVGDEWDKHLADGYYRGFLWQKVQEMLPDLATSITGVSVVTEDGKDHRFSYNPARGWTVRSSVNADTSGGKAVTVYRLLVDGREFMKEDYPTQALARAAGVKAMEENVAIRRIEVTPKTVREDGTAVVKLTRNTKHATAKVKVEYVKMKTENPTVTEYMVCFDYHH